ncbi:hypothetical protein GCM10010492_43720 [Saccharothrix mutabilis subsp. mutabilis]|uniref:Uncharacterized protein n=1 Tax=Saccharothrix mutabilis subsp. mutabilis TaxID=66855 RepID=A0ABP3DTP0_9PSEU|nr:hypothetical protein GCM10017745_04730 [Saccharothrix mutabilis subsp. capreolus]
MITCVVDVSGTGYGAFTGGAGCVSGTVFPSLISYPLHCALRRSRAARYPATAPASAFRTHSLDVPGSTSGSKPL